MNTKSKAKNGMATVTDGRSASERQRLHRDKNGTLIWEGTAMELAEQLCPADYEIGDIIGYTSIDDCGLSASVCGSDAYDVANAFYPLIKDRLGLNGLPYEIITVGGSNKVKGYMFESQVDGVIASYPCALVLNGTPYFAIPKRRFDELREGWHHHVSRMRQARMTNEERRVLRSAIRKSKQKGVSVDTRRYEMFMDYGCLCGDDDCPGAMVYEAAYPDAKIRVSVICNKSMRKRKELTNE